jgi:Electron transfer DM13
MKRFQMTIGALALVLGLTLASCSTSTETINDLLPVPDTQSNPPANNPPSNPPATGVITLSSGTFVSVNHPTTGTAKLIKLENGSHIVRLENFKTDPGPDVRVWVSETATITDAAQKSAVYTDVGASRSTNGNFNYEIPSSVDVSKIKSVIIWCRAFSVAFGGAALQ